MKTVKMFLANGHDLTATMTAEQIAGIRKAVEEQATGCYVFPRDDGGEGFVPWRQIVYVMVYGP